MAQNNVRAVHRNKSVTMASGKRLLARLQMMPIQLVQMAFVIFNVNLDSLEMVSSVFQTLNIVLPTVPLAVSMTLRMDRERCRFAGTTGGVYCSPVIMGCPVIIRKRLVAAASAVLNNVMIEHHRPVRMVHGAAPMHAIRICIAIMVPVPLVMPIHMSGTMVVKKILLQIADPTIMRVNRHCMATPCAVAVPVHSDVMMVIQIPVRHVCTMMHIVR